MNNFLKKILSMICWIGVFLLYYLFIPLFLAYFFKDYFKSSNKIISNISLALSEIIIFLVLFLIYRKKIIEDFKNFKTNYKSLLDTGFKYYFIGLLVMVASNVLMIFIMGQGSIATNEELNRQYLRLYPFYSIVAMVFFGPLIEEIVFRLSLRKPFNNKLLFCIVSALIFGGLHVYTSFEGMSLAQALKNWMQVLYIIPYGSLGFAFACAYYETDNIWTSMSIHMMHNCFTVLLIFLAM